MVGEIEDEYDQEEVVLWCEESPGCYLVLVKFLLDEFELVIGCLLINYEEIDEEEIDMLGGLVFMFVGCVFVWGEVVVYFDGIEFEVVDVDLCCIKWLCVILSD